MNENGYLIEEPIQPTENGGSPYSFAMGIFSVLLFVIAHVTGFSALLYIGALAMAFNFAMFSDDFLCLELLYLPLAPILKLSPDSAALLSYISILGIFVFLVRRGIIDIDLTYLLVIGGILILFLFKQVFQSFGITMVYIRLCITMAIAAIYLDLRTSDCDITSQEMRRANLFLTWGILLASLVGYFFSENENLLRYITLDANYIGDKIVSRFSGISSDPNYYSTLVIFAIAGNLFHFIHRPRASHIVYAVLLTAFGILSLSKMFLLLLAITLLLFLVGWIREKGTFSAKGIVSVLLLATIMLVGGYFIINSESVQLILTRMGASSNLNELTTGRSNTWVEYLKEIFGNLEYFLFGVNRNSKIAGVHLTHNTFLQVWWKLGLFGMVLVGSWFALMWQRGNRGRLTGMLMLLVGCFGPTLALDMLFFEQLFWFFIVIMMCNQALVSEEESSEE